MDNAYCWSGKRRTASALHDKGVRCFFRDCEQYRRDHYYHCRWRRDHESMVNFWRLEYDYYDAHLDDNPVFPDYPGHEQLWRRRDFIQL